jgi:hypothetical protein
MIAALAIAFCLGSCGSSESPDAMYRNYVDRLSNVTRNEPNRSEAPRKLPPYPAMRDLRVPEEDVRIGVSTYFALGECGLLGEISERNSSLGRLRSAGAQLLYDMRVFRGLTDCEQRIARSRPDDRRFREELERLRQAKGNNLPRAFWNASFASPEFRVLLATSAPPLARNESLVLSEVDSGLGSLTRLGGTLFDPSPNLDPAGLEQQYFHLQTSKRVGKLLQGLELSRFWLGQASAILSNTAAANTLCPAGRTTTRGEYLFNVFRKFYAGEVQPYLSSLHRQSAPILSAIDRLREAQRVEPPPQFIVFYDSWLSPDSRDGLWQHFNEELRRHTRAWQTVLTQCALMPADPADLQ